jgi:hypothetical protein
MALNAQTSRVDYENASKWFLGVNVGGTWNSTDVQNKTSVGWGLTLGRSYNFNSYSLLSFDLRARYLRGFWYGQDYDTTSMAGYSGGALNGYSSQGMIAHNFQTDVHRLGFELAVHLNRMTSRTGWDPYVFGGLGFTWHQAYGDLINQADTSGLGEYDYSSMVNSGNDLETQITNTLDGIYDSKLDGFSTNTYNVAFMPSLGFGLGYHIGKRVTLGIEHKTTFTLRDDFDGLVSNVRTKKDRYHYTSMYLQFRFTGKRPSETSSNVPCSLPRINVIQPTGAITVTNPQYIIEATIAEVSSANQISITTNTGQNIQFDFNNTTKKLSASVFLVPGANSYTIRVNNSCGFDSKVVAINLLNCTLPTAIFTNPAAENTTVKNAGYSFTAALTGITDVQGIKFYQNNMQITGFSYNTVNGLFMSNLNLQPGVNTFRLDLINSCGSNSFVTSLNYDNCVPPVISLVAPSATGTTVNNPNAVISFLANGVENGNQLTVKQNDILVSQVSFVNGRGNLNATLSPGINTFVIIATNACGNTAQTFTIDYQTCNAPQITLESPATSGLIVTAPTFVLKGKVLNIDSKQNVVVSINGLATKNISYVKASNSLEATINLVTGPNIISVTSTNGCGVDVETVTVNYTPCVAPIISLGVMSNLVTNSSYLFSATLLNQPSNQGVTLTLNGQTINFSYNSGILSASVNLATGNNSFVLTATTTCGTATKTWNVTNNNCNTPTILLSNPSATGTTVNSAAFVFKSIITGMNSSQGITLTLNGNQSIFTYLNGIITSSVNLNPGVNTFKLSLQNNCGSASNEVVVNYQNCTAPVISVLEPVSQNTTVTSASLALKANILNVVSAQNVSVKLNGMGVAFQYVSNLLTASLNLQPGANTILISSSNDCGTDVEAINLIYNNCIAPAIQVSNVPSLVTTTTNSLPISATLTGSNLNQGITFTQNGNIVAHTVTGNVLNSTVALASGTNIFVISAVNSCGADTKTFTVNYTPCIAPVVTITNPANSNLTLNTGSFTFQGSTQNVNTASELILLHNGVSITNFSFTNGQLVAPITLIPGINTLVLTATSACGTSAKTVIVIGKNCDAPVITISAPTSSGITVNNSQFTLQAGVTNLTINQGVSLSNNGNLITGYNFSNGQLTALITLSPGQNTLILSSSNECGNSSKTIVINYAAPCNPLVINFMNSIPSGGSTNATSMALSAQIQNYTANTAITVKVNGNPTTNYTNVNGLISGQLNLPNGTLTIEISATNNCGTATETYSISRCKETTITLNTPATLISSTTTTTQLVKFNVANVSNSNQIEIKVNGQSISGIALNGNEVSATINLNPGTNSIAITANNGCNSVNQVITINQSIPCNPLAINFMNSIPSGGSTSATSMALSAQIQNYTANTSITVKVNGNPTTNYTNVNGLISGQLNLPNGTLTIEISATNNCGTATETYTVSRCKEATVTLNSPSSMTVTTTNLSQLVSFNVANALNANQIQLSQNGQSISGFTFASNVVSATLNLVPGVNTIQIVVNNGCNTASKTITITYNPIVIEQTVLICVTPVDNPKNQQTIEIPISQLPTYLAQGAVLGACPQLDSNDQRDTTGLGNGNDSNSGNGQDNSGSGNGNNGHGNNADGVDSSNPGQGGGGPNGSTDQSGTVDDENGNGSEIPTNGNSTTTDTNNVNGNNSGNGNGNGNGNNGHGNNADGVDSSNPGQGGGGPNGTVDQSGTVDDENTNGNGSNTNGTGAGNNSGGGNNTGNNTGTETNSGGGNNSGNSNGVNSGQGSTGNNTGTGTNSNGNGNGNSNENGNGNGNGNGNNKSQTVTTPKPKVISPKNSTITPQQPNTTPKNTVTPKPTTTKPTPSKPAETKPTVTKPTINKPSETKPTETKPAETKPEPPKLIKKG